MNRRTFVAKTAALGLGLGLGGKALAKSGQKARDAAAPEDITDGPSPAMSGRIQSEWRWHAGTTPIYRLPKGVHLFTDWRYVDPGYLDWQSPDGKSLAFPGAGTLRVPSLYVDAFADH